MTNSMVTFVAAGSLSVMLSIVFVLLFFTLVFTIGFIKNDPWFMDEFTSNLSTPASACVVIISIILGICVSYFMVG